MPKPTGSSVKAARICNFQTEIATTVANLLRGHAVQADGFIARTSRAKGGERNGGRPAAANHLWLKCKQQPSEIWQRPVLPNGEGTMTDPTADKILHQRPQFRNTSIQHCLATATNTEQAV